MTTRRQRKAALRAIRQERKHFKWLPLYKADRSVWIDPIIAVIIALAISSVNVVVWRATLWHAIVYIIGATCFMIAIGQPKHRKQLISQRYPTDTYQLTDDGPLFRDHPRAELDSDDNV